MLTFEPALESDLDILFQLNKELIDTYEDCSAIDYDYVISWVKDNIQSNLGDFRRIVKDGTITGYFCVSIDTFHDFAELDSLFVLPGFRGQGIGTRVLQELKDNIHFPIYLYVFRENKGALKLYQRMGFQITEEVPPTRYRMMYD